MKGVEFMSDKQKKFNPIKKQPDDTVDTVYCNDVYNSVNILNGNDMLPYVSPLPKIRPNPEPPII